MNSFTIPLAVVYAGLAGTLLALIVATAQNKWSPRVFFLLALRLAIGWHFLFEGLYKLQTHYGPPTETSKPFSSEPYFRAAPGPLGAMMRKQFEDPEQIIAIEVKAPKPIPAQEFARLSAEDQAAACPAAVAQQFDHVKNVIEKQMADVEPEEQKAVAAATAKRDSDLKNAQTDVDKSVIESIYDVEVKAAAEKAKKTREATQKKLDFLDSDAGKTMLTTAKASYARWIYGVDRRDTKVKFITQPAPLTAPERLAHIERLRGEMERASDEHGTGLGNGYGTATKRTAELRMELVTAESDLVKDARAFIAELQKDLNGGEAVKEPVERSVGQRMDSMTMWALAIIGACIMAGLFTRVMCVLAAGFLIMTYLAHPAFPWYPIPPNTEGNPVFINKNVIECLALLYLACMPTGRWLGLDAIIMPAFCACCRRRKTESEAAPVTSQGPSKTA
jgi:uncharacterized membrane protein YphA (DoxX/SURF4 family)